MPDSSKKQIGWAYASLFAGVFGLVLSPLFLRWADAPGMVTSFYRMAITSLALTPFMWSYVKRHGWPKLKYLVFPLIGGVFSSLDHAFWSTGIERTTVANATLLNNLSPLWVALFMMLVWGERLRGRFWIGLVAVLVGASTVLGSTILIRPVFALGDYLAVISSMFYAGFFLATQKGRSVMDTLPYLWTMSVTAMTCLLLYTQVSGFHLTGYSQATYLTFLAAGLVSQLGAYYFIAYALGNLPASIVSPTLVAQPVMTALLAIPLMGEALLLPQVIGGMVTLGGIYLVNNAQRPSPVPALQT